MGFRKWLLGLAAGLGLAFSVHSARAQGIPNGITYQGMLLNNGAPYNGVVDLDFTFADSSGTSQNLSMTRAGVQVVNGLFNVVLGPFPASLDFDRQYGMTITATIGGSPITLPGSQLFWSAPYAFNAQRVGDAAVAKDSNGNPSLMLEGGIGATNPTAAADGTGLAAGSPQTMWADQVTVPAGTGTSIQIYNTLVSSTSTITVTAVGSSAAAGGVTITAQSAGTFTVSSKNTMGSTGGGTVTALNYMVVNH